MCCVVPLCSWQVPQCRVRAGGWCCLLCEYGIVSVLVRMALFRLQLLVGVGAAGCLIVLRCYDVVRLLALCSYVVVAIYMKCDVM